MTSRGVLSNWTVLPHRPLITIDERILTVVGTVLMPLMDFPRRMTVIQLTEWRVAIFSPIALDKPEMARIEAMGGASYLIVPSLHHRRDLAIWKKH
jgi:hypothetical protein